MKFLDVNQDALGKQAARRSKDGPLEVWSNPLADGTVAVGLFNRGVASSKITAKWTDLGLSGAQPVRDLWKRQKVGTCSEEFASDVLSHGAVLVKIGSN